MFGNTAIKLKQIIDGWTLFGWEYPYGETIRIYYIFWLDTKQSVLGSDWYKYIIIQNAANIIEMKIIIEHSMTGTKDLK